MALCPSYPGPKETFTHSHLSWSTTILYQLPPYTMIHSILPVRFTCLTVFLHKSSFIYLLVWQPPLYTPYISSPNHYLLFSTHAHTIATCFTVIVKPRLCHQIRDSISLLYLELLSFTLTSHIHLTILISVRWSTTSLTSFSYSPGLTSVNILLRTRLLYSLPLFINDISLLVSNGTNCLNLFHPSRILASTTASASPSTLNMSPK